MEKVGRILGSTEKRNLLRMVLGATRMRPLVIGYGLYLISSPAVLSTHMTYCPGVEIRSTLVSNEYIYCL